MKKVRFIITGIIVLAFLASFVSIGSASESLKININTATVKELTQLKKVGKKYAQNIIDHREKNGEFKAPEDIMQVKGIGAKIFELNKDLIVVK